MRPTMSLAAAVLAGTAALAVAPRLVAQCVSEPETCDGVDEDCDGTIDEGFAQSTWFLDQDADGYGDPSIAVQACAAPPGYVAQGDDCDDLDASFHPEAEEVCDADDNDCDSFVDEGTSAMAEACNLEDDDCDSFVDEGLGSACGDPIDVDGDGEVLALTDTLLLLRWAFGFTGATLTNGAVGAGCARCTAAEIIEYIQDRLLLPPPPPPPPP